jgi:hypothetical protein
MADKVALASQYIKARLAEENDTCLSLVSDDIVLVSQKYASPPKTHSAHFDRFWFLNGWLWPSRRDGTHEGKEAFGKYLKAVKPTGKWQDPVEEGDQVVIKGSVTVMFIPWSVACFLEFNADNKINKIEIKRV